MPASKHTSEDARELEGRMLTLDGVLDLSNAPPDLDSHRILIRPDALSHFGQSAGMFPLGGKISQVEAVSKRIKDYLVLTRAPLCTLWVPAQIKHALVFGLNAMYGVQRFTASRNAVTVLEGVSQQIQTAALIGIFEVIDPGHPNTNSTHS